MAFTTTIASLINDRKATVKPTTRPMKNPVHRWASCIAFSEDMAIQSAMHCAGVFLGTVETHLFALRPVGAALRPLAAEFASSVRFFLNESASAHFSPIEVRSSPL